MGTVGGTHEDEVVMRRWMGVSAAVGGATAAALTGSAWAGTPAAPIPAQRPPSPAHHCGHADTIAVSRTPGDGALRVEAVDGVADPVEGSFAGTTVRVRIPGQRTATATGSPTAEVSTALPAGGQDPVELRIDATFDDGITSCSWTTHVLRS